MTAAAVSLATRPLATVTGGARIVEFNPALAHPWEAFLLFSNTVLVQLQGDVLKALSTHGSWIFPYYTMYNKLYFFIKPVGLQDYWFKQVVEWIQFVMMLLRIWWSEGKPDHSC